MADELFVEVAACGYFWTQPIWKDSPTIVGVRSAYAAVENADVAEGADAVPTWIPLGLHRIVATACNQ